MKMFKVNGRRIAAKTIADAVEAYKANKEGNCKDASGVDFDYLLAEERKAVNDYRTAISQTDDPKLLTVLSHILKEETEHIEELEAARKGVYEDKGLMDAEVLTRQERIRFVEKLTAGLQKPPYNYDKMTANEIAIKRADALDPQWRARWGGDIEAQVRQELRNTAPEDSVRDSLSVVGKPINQFKGRKGVYTVLKVKENGSEKFLVTSEDVSKPGFSPAGTVENTLAEAIKTAKRYAASDSIRDGKEKQIARGIGWEVYYHDGRYYVDFFNGKPIGGHKTLQGAKEELYYAGKIPSKTAELKSDSLKAKDGIWTLPDTEEKYNKFKAIIKRRYEPKDVKMLTSELRRIWGQTELFDDLEDARGSEAIAYILKSYAKHLHEYLKIYNADPKLVAKAKAELG